MGKLYYRLPLKEETDPHVDMRKEPWGRNNSTRTS